jgi:4-hydroxy-tetrahydrodipicolinate synthase
MKLRGAWTALITPYRAGAKAIDTEALAEIVDAQIAEGIHGLVPCGTTGESPALSHQEHVRVVEIVMAAARGRVPVLAGAGSNSTAEAIDLAIRCKELGVDGTLQITPYYNKPTQAGMVAHFTAVAEASKLPIVLYNVPGRTGVDLQPETVAELAAHPLVVGVKEATTSMDRACRIRELCGPDFAILSGDDFTAMPLMAVGGDGVISVGSNVVPGLFARMCDAAAAGRWDEARELHYRQLPLARALFRCSSPIPVKAAMAILGRCQAEIRSPLQSLEPGSPIYVEVEDALRALELVGRKGGSRS